MHVFCSRHYCCVVVHHSQRDSNRQRQNMEEASNLAKNKPPESLQDHQPRPPHHKNTHLLHCQLEPPALDGTLILTGALSTAPPLSCSSRARSEPVARRSCRGRERNVAYDSERRERKELLEWVEDLPDWELSRKISSFFLFCIIKVMKCRNDMCNVCGARRVWFKIPPPSNTCHFLGHGRKLRLFSLPLALLALKGHLGHSRR